jgi:hypothetical protein
VDERIVTGGRRAADGWGAPLRFTVERPGRPTLMFRFQLPAAVRLIDVRRLAASGSGVPSSVGHAAKGLSRAAAAGGVIVIGAICTPPEPDGPVEVLATVTAALSEVAGPPRIEDHLLPESGRADQEVTRLSEQVTRIRRLSVESLSPDQEPVPMLMIQYLVQTEYGAMSMAFSTTHHEMFGPSARALYQRIFETGFIGEPSAG